MGSSDASTCIKKTASVAIELKGYRKCSNVKNERKI